jgi:hypothetical protein
MSSQTMTPRRTPRKLTGPGSGPGERTGCEESLLVEDAVIGQIVLQADGRDRAAVEQHRRVVKAVVDPPQGTDQERRAIVRGRRRQLLDGGLDLVLEERLQDQVLGRIAADDKLREHDQVGALGRRRRARLEDTRDVAVEVADGRVDLGQGDGEMVGHGFICGGCRIGRTLPQGCGAGNHNLARRQAASPGAGRAT